MSLYQKAALFYLLALAGAASLNYIPGVTDEDGVAFGIFALDIFDDALHAASALWALAAAIIGVRASYLFLLIFGTLYLGDGILGLATGSGYLDFGIFTYGVQDLPFGFKILANTPHILLGLGALVASLPWENRR
ncbi:MAG: hypothetical protein KJN93_00565 [Alphaproteobacteria bacterium]|nr:hypothetical protein [Alphaproteobacteria bacterium]